ncbi:FG-GAP-like repeat-containing protein [Janibacter melonis]|uniref:FG-GAP-like repeat-containing protein n=1 Tax=Janibacter melonis TaxID=262209 RepID=UPI0020432888|nr:FG-GAP-like repeat-containing protein [Janibacter melonis]MCM3556163.1 FG-GAP-like repeat-containing protein [Janibacter melonis]
MSVRSTWRSRAGLTVAGAAVAATALSTAAPASAADSGPVDLQVVCDGVGEDTVTVTGDLASGGTAAIASGPLTVVGRPGFTGTDAAGRAVSVAPTGDGVTCTARSTVSAGSLRQVLPSTQAAKGATSSSVTGRLTFTVTVDADSVNTAAARRAEASGETTTAAAGDFPFEYTLRTYLAGRPGAVGVAVRIPGTSRVYTYTKTNARNVTASIVKTEIMAAVMMRAQDAGRGLTDWEKSKIVPMIRYSDNGATTDLFNSIGGRAALDRASARLGMTATYADSGGRWGLTSTVPQDQARLMEHFARATGVLSQTNRDYGLTQMRSISSDQDWGVTAGAPAGTVALKNGWLPRTDGWHVNSIGYSTSGQDYTIGVLTHDDPGAFGTQITTIEGVSRIIHKYKDRLVPSTPPPAPPARGTFGDVDGDGRADLVGTSASGTMYLYRGDGRGSFADKVRLKTGPKDATWYGSAGDLNRDKRADLLVRRGDGRLQLWMSSGSTGYASPRTIATSWGSYTSIASGTDIDGNGSLDVVTRSVGGGATLHSINDSGRLTTVRTMGKPFVWYPTILATTDLDGDGRGDIRGVATGGRMRAWRSTGTTWSQLSGTTLGWDRYSVVASPGDVNGSSTGQADVIGLEGRELHAWWGSADGSTSGPVRLGPSGYGMVHLF